MTWSDFYLICFAVGFCFSFFSFRVWRIAFRAFASAAFSWARAGICRRHGAGGHAPATGAHAPVREGATGRRLEWIVEHRFTSVSPFNPPVVAAFLAWFGGTGYLLTRFSAVWVGMGLAASIISGLVGGGIIFLFLSKVLISDEDCLDPADFEMVGVLGKLSVPIREGGTGELIYSQMGTRRVCGARSEERRCDRERDRGCGHAVREGNRIRAAVGRDG